ncbi:tRNA methyltransferas-like protein [Mytilinidion resinicola]|uniref:tRNA methyltransferas-like protein n=1 Tax=Mytilinidion resinicola TaxID=574789 RepID=A0A6A6YDS3_9PEZI|nr:tRNA methyltransferas-like protein [Mytilinidion resinicola]KAF2806880.1 tRNA methyltransferas-like protein [Mytilinidion resinicola]
MAIPFQCVRVCRPDPHDQSSWLLLAASGPRIYSSHSSGGTSVWSSQKSSESAEPVQADESQEPPGKKVKLSKQAEEPPNVSKLLVTSNSQHLVAVTAEDKCLRVFRLDLTGRLEPLSQRSMPKRPCAVTMIENDATILCADKFGDVYALPLLPSPTDADDIAVAAQEKETSASFVPTATPLTVHSGRNRKALEDQLKQKLQPKTKEPLKFKHDLLLGHVSMLTEILYAEVEGEKTGAKPRTYIFTADRDEHIRISRGPPQSHIIEGFCQGHREFVSKLCLSRSGDLISGGGDDDLIVWDWLSCRVLERISIKQPVLDFLKAHPQHAGSPQESEGDLRVAVSGIWAAPSTFSRDSVLVTCEGVPALFHFIIDGRKKVSSLQQTLPLTGNPLDLTLLESGPITEFIVVSIDQTRAPGSATMLRQKDDVPSRMQAFSLGSSGGWNLTSMLDVTLERLNSQAQADALLGREAEVVNPETPGKQSPVQDILYGIENLRKRAGAED